jgi:hypothetical protein
MPDLDLAKLTRKALGPVKVVKDVDRGIEIGGSATRSNIPSMLPVGTERAANMAKLARRGKGIKIDDE